MSRLTNLVANVKALIRHPFRRPVPPDLEFIAGHPSEWIHFEREVPGFVKVLPNLVRLAEVTFDRTMETASPTDRVVFSFGVMCWEDFEEIQLLGMNGYGFGCLKISRGMYERVVTTRYLHDREKETAKETETERFLDYHPISDYKLAREILDTLGPYEDISAESVAEKKKLADEARRHFVRSCSTKDCEKQIPMYSWSTLDLVSMARTNQGLKELVGICYYLPMTYTHPTVSSILSRLSVAGEATTFATQQTKARQWSTRAVCASHNLMLRMFETQAERFPAIRPAVEPLLAQAVQDYVTAWNPSA